MNDPVALLLVTGFIDWIQDAGLRARRHGRQRWRSSSRSGSRSGSRSASAARWCFRNLDLPSPGLYPVASIATAALAYGVPELVHGSGFLVRLHRRADPRHRADPRPPTTIAFHQGLSLGRPDLALRPARPARLPQRARRRRRRGAAALGGADLRRPPARRLRRQRLLAVQHPRAADARLGRACAARSRSGSRPSRSSPGSATRRADLQLVFFVVVTSTLIQGSDLRAAGEAPRA